jgi:hypothetical protein
MMTARQTTLLHRPSSSSRPRLLSALGAGKTVYTGLLAYTLHHAAARSVLVGDTVRGENVNTLAMLAGALARRRQCL